MSAQKNDADGPWPASWDAFPKVGTTQFSLDGFVRKLPRTSTSITATLSDIHTLRGLAIERIQPPLASVFRFRLSRWVNPGLAFVGTTAPHRSLRSFEVAYGTAEGEETRVVLRFATPVPLSDAAHVAFPLFAPARGTHGSGFPKLLLPPGAPSIALGQLPTVLPIRPTVTAHSLRGVGLPRGEFGVTGLFEPRDELDDHVGSLYRVAADGHLGVSDRLRGPSLDLHLHNPIGIRQTFSPADAYDAVLVDDEDRLLIRRRVTPQTERLEWRIPLRTPLAYGHVQRLRGVQSIDFARMHVPQDERSHLLMLRIAEIMATGTVISSLRTLPVGTRAFLHADMRRLIAAPYTPTYGLAREVRSVAQRRLSLRTHAGFLGLADRIEGDHGYRMLPTVSVVISSQRPSRIPTAMRAIRAQTYPHLETVVAMHGAEMPDMAELHAQDLDETLSVFQVGADVRFGEALARAVRRSSGDLIVKVDDDDLYGPEFIWDLVLAYLYSSADLVGKTTEYLYFEEIEQTAHRRFTTEAYQQQAAGGAMMLSRSTFDAMGGWRPTRNSVDRSVLVGLVEAGGIGYRTHGLGYAYVRHGEGHTWAQDEASLVAQAFEQWVGFPESIITQGVDQVIAAGAPHPVVQPVQHR